MKEINHVFDKMNEVNKKKKKKQQKKEKRNPWKIATIVLAVIAVVLFLSIEVEKRNDKVDFGSFNITRADLDSLLSHGSQVKGCFKEGLCIDLVPICQEDKCIGVGSLE